VSLSKGLVSTKAKARDFPHVPSPRLISVHLDLMTSVGVHLGFSLEVPLLFVVGST